MSHNKISLIKSIQILSSFVVARFLKRYHPKISKMKDLDKLILISHAHCTISSRQEVLKIEPLTGNVRTIGKAIESGILFHHGKTTGISNGMDKNAL